MKVWLNERLCDARQARVSVFDHGFLYGDGIYETVRAYDYRVFHWREHDRRLRISARRIALACPWSRQTLERRIVQVLKANRQPNASVRITIARGPGPLGLSPKLCPQPTLVMLLHPDRNMKRVWRQGITIGITAVRRNHPLCLDPQIKSNNSLNTILAKMEAEAMRVFEGVLVNLDGHLTEGTTSNIFFVKRGELFTPSLDCGLLEGITRAAILDLARDAQIKIHEGRYTPRELLKADESFLVSTTLEVAPVTGMKISEDAQLKRIGNGKPGPISCRLHDLFRANIHKASNQPCIVGPFAA